MMTKSVWVFATTALLATAACSSDSNPEVSEETGTATEPTTTAGTTGTTSGSAGRGGSGTTSTGTGTSTGSAGRGTPTASGGSGAVSTGNTGAAGASAGSAGARAGAGGTAGSQAGSGGAAGSGDDDADAGVTDDVEEMPAAGSGGTGAAGAGAAGRSAAGAGGTVAAGRGAAGAGGAMSEGPRTMDVPADTAAAGPWPVGVRTLTLSLGAGNTQVEVWYPAKRGSESERPKVSYDLTAWLPPEHGIPNAAPKVQLPCDCYRELPPDADNGPFPVVVYVHGQASFRASAASQLAHWASRGFIAIAADHPGLVLRDTLSGNATCSGTGIPQDFAHTRDVPALFAALAQPDGIFNFLEGAIDAQRVALAGHGDGAAYAADNVAQPGVKAVLSLSAASVVPRADELAGAFFLSGQPDKITAYNNVVRAYEATGRELRPALLAGVANVGHLGFTDMCGARNTDGQDAIAMARRYDICGGAAINVADQYFWDCPLSPLAGADNYLDQAATHALTRKLSTLALEELLLGENRTQAWNEIAADTAWGELRQTR
ncbi:MAG TPA: hypothetical protein VMF89_06110 [Polyangiales bacterium]|nr:hypothetical protein [Polyangiales bacterium]